MSDIKENHEWSETIYEIATTDDVIGGADGISNRQATQLAGRSNFLRRHVEALESGSTPAGQARQLSSARNIRIDGDASGSCRFDGGQDVSLTLTQKRSGVAPGSYRRVTVNEQGVVLEGGNPTTLAEYAISDAAPIHSPHFQGRVTVGVDDNGGDSLQVGGSVSATLGYRGVWLIPDVRDKVSTPESYQGFAATFEFKTASNVDLPPSRANGSFAHTLTVAGYDAAGAAGGGLPAQLSFGDGLSIRQANSASSWGAWRNIWHDGNLTRLSQLANDQAFIQNQYLQHNRTNDANAPVTYGGIHFHYLLGDNRPAGMSDGALLSLAHSPEWATQMTSDWRTNQFYIRSKNDGTWCGWSRLISDTQVPLIAKKVRYHAADGSSIDQAFSEHGFDYDTAGAGFSGPFLSFGSLNALGSQNSSTYQCQFMASYAHAAGLLKFRTQNGDAGGVWNPWRTLWHDGNLQHLSQLQNDAGYRSHHAVAIDIAALDSGTAAGDYRVISPEATQMMLVFDVAGSVGPVQLMFNYAGGFSYRNQRDSGTWTPWKTLWNNENLTSLSQLKNDLSVFPAGTRMPFAQAVAPTGWTQDLSDSSNNRMLRVVHGSGGNVGGVHDPSINHVVAAHTHSFTTGGISANHTHGVNDQGHSHLGGESEHQNRIGGEYGAYVRLNIHSQSWTKPATTNIWLHGADTDHSHSGSTDNGSSQTNWQPRYLDMIICVKD
ncbi:MULTISPECIES: hypothetical protein [unclassified Undibacterium]|uniref:pyocin knob domain-containing protein n=1 Tax=unclassified Undibacterium TaxID=2630295 RepID=UPI002AC999B0|nr:MULTISPECIES: hypothetical protein [unclassified Undibacterium]MEB0137989.1 hypothetical protein [Undibacterium sp. CCC2.1]MEB0170678.1 hypothetical protein [Undibacterium sp. CCC1.1]MEB0177019.1 hypothetical protein [Undibacterium sp. CCC3.4]MEB0216308.1 hypothetical protein [Undibacterium sp. 5I2]WPX42492.1 hypothetical protein RHM61_13980 [Undibacterium sp. CCC3.4]